MTRVIVVTSGKGGVGKTNISVNTAVELASRGLRTCLFDADLGLANVNILFGISPARTIDDFVYGDSSLEEIIVHGDWGVDIIPGSSGVEKLANLSPDHLKKIIAALSELSEYDYFIIDTSSGISRSVISFCLAAPEIVLVLTAETTSLTDAYAVLKVLSANEYNGRVKILVNKSPDVPQAKNTYIHFKTVTDKHLNIDVSPVGAVLEDPQVEEAIREQQPFITLFPHSVASQCLRSIVENLLKRDVAENSDWNFELFWRRFFDELGSDRLLPELKSRNKNLTAGRSDKHRPGAGCPAPDSIHGEDTGSERLVAAQSIAQDRQRKYTITDLPVATDLLDFVTSLLLSGKLDRIRLGSIVAADPVLTAKVMQLFFITEGELPERGCPVEKVVQTLDFSTVTNLLFIVCRQLCFTDLSPELLEYTNTLSRKSHFCAHLSRAVARHVGYPDPEEAYWAGLFLHLGQLRLAVDYPDYITRKSNTFAERQALVEQEQGLCGMNRAEVGAAIAQELKCNSLVSDAIGCHCMSTKRIATAFDLTRLVYVAHRLCFSTAVERAEAAEIGASFFRLPANHFLSIFHGIEEDLQAPEKQVATGTVGPQPAARTAESLKRLRGRILDYALLKTVLPGRAEFSGSESDLRIIFQNLYMFFGLREVFVLYHDPSCRSLRAIGYPGCYGDRFLAGIWFACASEQSFVVKTFNTGKTNIVHFSELLSLGDKQLLARLRSKSLVCVPVCREGSGEGVIVFGTDCDAAEFDVEEIAMLEQFAAFSVASLTGP